MAKEILTEEYQDDILAANMNGLRKYRMINNGDNTFSFVDVTDYEAVGTEIGAAELKRISKNINESADKNKIIDDLEIIKNVTEEGYIAGAKAVGALNNSLGDISTIGNETYNSFEKLLRYYIDNNFLPDVNMSPLIPIMTSNTTPSGEVIFGGIHPSYSGQEFKAFDDNDTTKFFDADGANGAYVGYKFEKPVCAKLFSLLFERIPQEFSIEASNDGNTWVPLVRKANNSNNKFEKETLNNNNEYLYYRYKKIVGDKTWGSSYLLSFQLYGRKNF